MRGIVTRANAVQREIGHHEPLGIVSTLAHDAKAHALVPAQRGYSSLGFFRLIGCVLVSPAWLVRAYCAR